MAGSPVSKKPKSKKKPSVRECVLDFLLANRGKVVTGEQIKAYVRKRTGAPCENWHQRLSELRTEYGWDILSWRDRDYLKPGEYLLEHDRPTRPAHKREPIPEKLRRQVIERDKHCQYPGCGLAEGDIDPVSGAVVRLQADHVVPSSAGGSSTLDNLKAMCPRHQVTKKNFYKGDKPDLIQMIRAAKHREKKEAYALLYEYFDGKHPDET